MFADFIRTSGLTRTQWADRLGISRSYLSDILNGNKMPSLVLATAIERETGGQVLATSWVPEAAPRPVAPTPTPEEDAA
jgi:transcriptional regulator with XRE-family HTH domain